MTAREIVTELRAKDEKRRLAVSEAAADALEMLEERLEIIGERLTMEEWAQTEQEARQRIAGWGQ